MSRASFIRAEPDARRQALVDAAVGCLAELGARGISVREVSARAGVSPGLLRHYFAGIDDLVAAAYAHVGEQVSATLNAAMEAAGPDPRARLTAYVVASFRSPIADPALLATWLAFWSLVKTDAEIARLHGAIYAGYREVIEDLVRQCTGDRANARLAAVGLTALVDGLWLELSLDPTTFTPGEAETIAERWVDALVAEP